MPRIMKNRKPVGTFIYDEKTRKFDLSTKDQTIQRISKSVPGIKSKYDPENDALVSYAVTLQPGDPDYAFHLLAFLATLGYQVEE